MSFFFGYPVLVGFKGKPHKKQPLFLFFLKGGSPKKRIHWLVVGRERIELAAGTRYPNLQLQTRVFQSYRSESGKDMVVSMGVNFGGGAIHTR